MGWTLLDTGQRDVSVLNRPICFAKCTLLRVFYCLDGGKHRDLVLDASFGAQGALKNAMALR